MGDEESPTLCDDCGDAIYDSEDDDWCCDRCEHPEDDHHCQSCWFEKCDADEGERRLLVHLDRDEYPPNTSWDEVRVCRGCCRAVIADHADRVDRWLNIEWRHMLEQCFGIRRGIEDAKTKIGDLSGILARASRASAAVDQLRILAEDRQWIIDHLDSEVWEIRFEEPPTSETQRRWYPDVTYERVNVHATYDADKIAAYLTAEDVEVIFEFFVGAKYLGLLSPRMLEPHQIRLVRESQYSRAVDLSRIRRPKVDLEWSSFAELHAAVEEDRKAAAVAASPSQ